MNINPIQTFRLWKGQFFYHFYYPQKSHHLDGRPQFAKLSIDNVEKVEIAAIDPDFIEAETSVPDGMR